MIFRRNNSHSLVLVKSQWRVMALAALLTLPLADAQQDQRAELLLRAAIHKETVDGDLKGAIDQYKKVVARAGANRAFAARALIRMGQCYEKLGDQQARGTYEKLLRDYADQREIAAEARSRLTALARPRAAGPEEIGRAHV